MMFVAMSSLMLMYLEFERDRYSCIPERILISDLHAHGPDQGDFDAGWGEDAKSFGEGR